MQGALLYFPEATLVSDPYRVPTFQVRELLFLMPLVKTLPLVGLVDFFPLHSFLSLSLQVSGCQCLCKDKELSSETSSHEYLTW